MKKSKILISAVTMFSLCITPMSVYAQVDPNSNIENTISQTKSAENLPTPVLQEKEIEVSNGTGYSLNNIQGAETVKALEQGTIVISYKATGENAIQSLFSVGNGTNGNQNRHFHIYVTNSGGVGMELRNTDGQNRCGIVRIVQEEWTLKHGVLKTILQKPIIIIDSGVFEKHA